jgi:choline monooxygenase
MGFEIAFNEQLASASTLPSSLYTDQFVLQVEKEEVFGRTWQLVGREEQVAVPGQFFTATVADEPILVVRGTDGTLRALSNVCRHRAGPVASGEGTCKAFRCGYHGWTYALDGRLLGTPEFEGVENFRKEDHSLPQFRVDTWLGLIFVNLDSSARQLSETIGELAEPLRRRGVEAMHWAARKDWTIQCNWKVYVDNYLEGYHIPIVHPGLMQELDYSRYRTETKGAYSVQQAPLSETARGRLRKDADASVNDAQFFWIFPNLMLNVYSDNFSTNLILPITHETTLTTFEWFFRDPETAEVGERIRQTVEFSDEIQREDIAICEAVQKGLRSRTYQSGRYSVRRESGVHHFHSLLSRCLRQGQGTCP